MIFHWLPLLNKIASRLPAWRGVDIVAHKTLWNSSRGEKLLENKTKNFWKTKQKTFGKTLQNQTFKQNSGSSEPPRRSHKTEAEVLQEVDKGDLAV